MKLIFCRTCQDFRGLDIEEWRTCSCGDCGGMYDPIDERHDRAIVSAVSMENLHVLGLDSRWCAYPGWYDQISQSEGFMERGGLAWPYQKEHKLTRILGRPSGKADVLWRIETGHESVTQRSDLRSFLGPSGTVQEEIPAV